MTQYAISQVYPGDIISLKKIDELLENEGIKRDKNLDYICAIYDDYNNIIATGSCFANTLRCFAVHEDFQGEGLLNQIVSHLIDFQYQRGIYHIFIYTKPESSMFFKDLGFYEIARIESSLVFMENKKNAFQDYLNNLLKTKRSGLSSAIVLNANPFTLGHQYLIERASKESDSLHLFMVSEDSSLIPFSVRKNLIIQGTKHLDNIIYHETGPYISSNATFPSYFLKDEEDVIKNHALLDLTLFKSICHVLSIKTRYVGEEPNSLVTSIYNEIMSEELPNFDINCKIISRKKYNDIAISASIVRKLIKKANFDEIKNLVSQTTYEYLISEDARPIIKNIQKSKNIIHY